MKPRIKIFKHIAVAILAVLLLIAFPVKNASAAEETQTVTEPSLETSKITLVENYEGYTIRFRDIEDNAPLYFSSSDESVAKVDETGFVTPVKAGSATILVTVVQGEKTVELKLSVEVKEPHYKVIQSNEGCHIGGTIMFEILQMGYEDETKWSLTGSQYAKLEPMTKTSARLTGLSDGIVTVTLESREKKTSFKVRIIEGKGEIYAVAPGSKPYEDKYLDSSYYNSHTKDYYMLRSYLERLDEAGGGTLLLKRGTYTITNILCIPSNTKVVLSDGVLIEKTYETGNSSFGANRSIFQTVSFTDFFKYEYSSKYTGLKGYNGAHDVKLIGEGNATIDLKGLDTCAFVIGHAKNIVLKGITMLNMNTNHFVELDAADGVTITNCVFKGSVDAGTSRKQKEAINIDTPDATTGGFTQNWSSFDCTPVKNVTISDNIFEELESAIGTHRYSGGKVHTGITIMGNLFFNMTDYGIRAMNWKKTVITGNDFCNTGTYEDDVYAVILNGTSTTKITGNRFINYDCGITAYNWKNGKLKELSGGSQYDRIYNVFTDKEIEQFKKNYHFGLETKYIEIYNNKTDTIKEKDLVKYDYLPECALTSAF